MGASMTTNTVDDFTRIHGIGSAVEKRLQDAGILTYEQLAERSTTELAGWVRDMVGFTEERVIEQDWKGQAKKLAAEQQLSLPENHNDIENSPARQQYAAFKLELLLDEKKSIRRTNVLDIVSQDEKSWSGWNEDNLRSFISKAASVQFPEEAEPVKAPAAKQKEKVEPAAAAPLQMKSAQANISGEVRYKDIQILSNRGEILGMMIKPGHSINIRLILDLGKVALPQDESLHYDGHVFVKNMLTNERRLLAKSEGSLIRANEALIDLRGQPLQPGEYRLEALVILRPDKLKTDPSNQLMVLSEGHFLKVSPTA